MTTALQALVRRDLRLFFADRRAVIMSFIAPIAIASFFGYIFGGGGGNQENSRIPVLVIDQDGSAISQEIVSRLRSDKALEMKSSAPDQARSAVQKGTATVALIIPKDFGANAGRAFFGTSTKPEIGMLYDPSHAAEQAMLQGILAGDVMQVVSKEMFTGQAGRETLNQAVAGVELNTMMPSTDKRMLLDMLRGIQQWNQRSELGSSSDTSSASTSGGLTMPYALHAEAVTAGKGVRYNGYAHSFAGMGVQFILFMGVEVGIGVLLQRQRGLWKRLRAAPLSRAVLLGSRALSAAITSMLILAVIFSFARLVFGVHIQGSMAGFLGVCIAFSLMTATAASLLASSCVNLRPRRMAMRNASKYSGEMKL